MADSKDEKSKPITSLGTPTLNQILESLKSTGTGSGSLLGGTASLWTPEFFLDEVSRSKLNELQSEVTRLQRKLDDESKALQKEKTASKGYANQVTNLQTTLSDLQKIMHLGTLLKCVNNDGYRYLLESESFQQLFLGETNCDAFVVSIDIRRSTELMLKARSAEAFASFTTALCSDLMEVIKESYGVIDKFTGDGVLAYFPDFFSGPDAAYRAIFAAHQCHASFSKHYRAQRTSFKALYNNVGLGIGIDYGPVQLVQIAGGLTVVGEPVVYACRLSAAPAGITLLNERAYEVLVSDFSKTCFVDETSIDIKHEGPMLAYAVKLNDRFPVELDKPEWVGQIGAADTPGKLSS